ncbi:hypothetical protein [Parerythrobacter lacustris]|uniref:Uncharacterized protein n=1 Tax=Parerythrobacter lacustris TaxID=2969984 RepID=A0ABT1XPT7_9SPHN|nr:hypothetical protein [Parerythrobacter lacustris]MCR2832936.1 hypothetical protein [Parerythrobacter lacustris]
MAATLAGCQFLPTNEPEDPAKDKPAALVGGTTAASGIDWGDDVGEWANDGECDDKRFSGDGMTSTPLLDEDIGHDATDCRTAYEAGKLTYSISTGDKSQAAATRPQSASGGIDWGDDRGDWANDGECDDSRFTGAGMTSTPLLDEDIRHDATDCREQFERGRLQLK